jgi:hypothetical protein
MTASPGLRVCSYEDRPEAIDSLILMAESLCRLDRSISLHFTVPAPPDRLLEWAKQKKQVSISTTKPEGVTGWDVKPWLLLRELDAGVQEAVWLDTDIVVTQPLSSLLAGFPHDTLIVTEEWIRTKLVPVSQFWRMPSVRPIALINACVVRATQSHRRLLETWHRMLCEPIYRQAQTIPFDQRPTHMLHDGWLLVALLESEEFGDVPFETLRLGRHIAQCAGSSGYGPGDRLLGLFRGLPPIIHCIGRKPWAHPVDASALNRYLLGLATDVSPYVLAAQRIARDLNMNPDWLRPHTRTGAALRMLTNGHPGMAGLPLAALHAIQQRIGRLIRSSRNLRYT